MKTIFIILALIAAPALISAQVKPIANFYNKYSKLEHADNIQLQGWLLRLAAKHADDENGKELLRKISNLRVLTVEGGNPVNPEDYRQLLEDVRRESFEGLIRIRDGRGQVDLLIREQNDVVTDLLIVVNGSSGFTLLSMEGSLRFSELNDLEIDVEGADQLRKLPENRKGLPKT